MKEGICVICGRKTKRGQHHGGPWGKYKKTCSKKCMLLNRKEIIKKMHLGIQKNRDEISRKSSERMKKNNPMKMPGIREKAMATNRALGTRPKIRGGNGREMPIPQRTLLAALGNGWYAEHVVITGFRPPCYKIDIANPKLMIAIEVDGESHGALIRQAQYRKKEEFLKTLGWEVIRFKNKYVMKDLQNVLQCLNSIVIKKN